MIKRIMYASIFIAAVLFVMQSKGMLDRLRQWLYQHEAFRSGEPLEEIEEPMPRKELSEEEWELVQETPEALVYEAQQDVNEMQQVIYSMGSSLKEIRAGLTDKEQDTLCDMKRRIKNLITQLDIAREEVAIIMTRTIPNYVNDAKETIQDNFEGVNLSPDQTYVYLYGEKASQGPTYFYTKVAKDIQDKLSDPTLKQEEKNILRQIYYLLRTAAGKEQFDAYLKDDLDTLAITDKKEIEHIQDLYQSIEDVKTELADIENIIKQLLR